MSKARLDMQGRRGVSLYDFHERLAFSRGVRETTDIDAITAMIPGVTTCRKTSTKEDRAGVDYEAVLRHGARLKIDAKARDRGASRFWHGEPDLALEVWSVIPCPDLPKGKAGWTLSESSETDLILYTFDPSDTNELFLFGFQHLRAAFRQHIVLWRRMFGEKEQSSGDWKSSCVFVPVSIVFSGIERVSRGRQVSA